MNITDLKKAAEHHIKRGDSMQMDPKVILELCKTVVGFSDRKIFEVSVLDQHGRVHTYTTAGEDADFNIAVRFGPSMFTEDLAGVVELDLFDQSRRKTVCFLNPVKVYVNYEDV